MSRTIFCGWFLAFGLWSGGAIHAQEFTLEAPGVPPSRARIAGDELIIQDAQGQEFVYLRDPKFDRADGKYQAYFSRMAGQFLRWPVSGTGPMLIGRLVGGDVDWTKSRMSARPIGLGAGGIYSGPRYPAAVVLSPDLAFVAEIDQAGRIQFYEGHARVWKNRTAKLPAGVGVPGAPLALWTVPGEALPRVLTIDAAGKLIVVSQGEVVTAWPQPAAVQLLPGGQFAQFNEGGANVVVAVDRKGHLWWLPEVGKPQQIEGHSGILQPGSPVVARSDHRELFLTDRKGAVVVYLRETGDNWHGPEFLAGNFQPAGHLAVWEPPGAGPPQIVAVDRAGRLQILRLVGPSWRREHVGEDRFIPGSPLIAMQLFQGLSISGVTADGRWVEVSVGPQGSEERELAAGFASGAPLAYAHPPGVLFAVDRTGRLLAATWSGEQWETFLCLPGELAGPQIVSRKIIREGPIDPVTVQLHNSSRDDMLVRLLDRRAPAATQELKIAPGRSQEVNIDRDSGGTLVETFLVPGPLGEPVQKERRIPLPPQSIYDVVVYSNRVTYSYIDRRQNRGPVPDYDETSLVSRGAFPLPAGPGLQSGQELDVEQILAQTGNPGAAALLDGVP